MRMHQASCEEQGQCLAEKRFLKERMEVSVPGAERARAEGTESGDGR